MTQRAPDVCTVLLLPLPNSTRLNLVYGLVGLGSLGSMVKVGGKVPDYHSLNKEPFFFDQPSKSLRCQPLGDSPFVRDILLECQCPMNKSNGLSPRAWQFSHD